MAAPSFVCKTEKAGLVALSVERRPSIEMSDLLHEELSQRCSREVANLFAEPVIAPDGASISWYAAHGGDPVPLKSLDPERRRGPEALLRQRLGALAPLLGDPELRSLLACALQVASADDILVMDGQPLMVNWGLVPQQVADNSAALARHFAATLGPYAPFPAPAQRVAAAVAAPPAETNPPPSAAWCARCATGSNGRLLLASARDRVRHSGGDSQPTCCSPACFTIAPGKQVRAAVMMRWPWRAG